MKIGWQLMLVATLLGLLACAVSGQQEGDIVANGATQGLADTLASELLRTPGGLNALATKLHDRADAEKAQAETDEAASLLFHRASASHNPRFKRYAASRLSSVDSPTPANDLVRRAQAAAAASMDFSEPSSVSEPAEPERSAAAAVSISTKDPNVILKALERQGHRRRAAARRAAAAKAQKASAAKAGSTVDAGGFDWGKMRKSAGPKDPAMRALERESGKIDDVYDPTEDPDNVGPPAAHKDAIPASYWTSKSSSNDAWWNHGGEDGMTDLV